MSQTSFIPNNQTPTNGQPSMASSHVTKMYCDAGTKNNGADNQRCIIVVADENGKILAEEWIGNKTNNEGELAAMRKAADCVPKNRKGEIVLSSDSQLAVRWVNLEYFTDIERLVPQIYETIKKLRKKGVKVIWEGRENNIAGQYIEKEYSL